MESERERGREERWKRGGEEEGGENKRGLHPINPGVTRIQKGREITEKRGEKSAEQSRGEERRGEERRGEQGEWCCLIHRHGDSQNVSGHIFLDTDLLIFFLLYRLSLLLASPPLSLHTHTHTHTHSSYQV